MTSIQDIRANDLEKWLGKQLKFNSIRLIPGDASTRRYFRVNCQHQNFIAVDASPLTENNLAFVSIAKAFLSKGLKVPQILEVDYELGFLLLTDLGDIQLLKVLNEQNVNEYYSLAMEDLIQLQTCTNIPGWKLPLFDEGLLLKELNRFPEWYLEKHLGLTITDQERSMLEHIFELLIESARSQPQVCVHRDYHSRNLMVLPKGEMAMLDFQDAVIGPLSYDLVSLLRDCYINWPEQNVYAWVNEFRHLLIENKRLMHTSLDTFVRWFDWMGIQRHLKVLGIFARLFKRDSKANYLQEIPRILDYLLYVASRYTELAPIKEFIINRVIPHESHDISRGARQTHASTHG